MARIPTPKLEEMSDAQRRVHERIVASRGNLDGPFAVWLHSPEAADRAQHLGEFVRYQTSLPGEGRLSELAILLVARHHCCQAEWSIHEPIALSKGLEVHIIDAVRHGQRPAQMAREDAALYDFVTQLLADHFVSTQTFDEALARFGEQTLVELTLLVGYYSLVAMTLNAFQVAVPSAIAPGLPDCPSFAPDG